MTDRIHPFRGARLISTQRGPTLHLTIAGNFSGNSDGGNKREGMENCGDLSVATPLPDELPTDENREK